MALKPITPKDVAKQKLDVFPDAVIEAFNEVIAAHYSNGSATITQKEVVERMVAKGLKKDNIFDKGWLDVEDVYRKAGWTVKYDKPGYNESYEPIFIFKKRTRQ